jgi:hypothetical protein
MASFLFALAFISISVTHVSGKDLFARLPRRWQEEPLEVWHALRHFAIYCGINAGFRQRPYQTFAGHSGL